MQTTTFRTNNLFHYKTVIVKKNPDFGYQSYDVYDLENMNSADWKAQFRVEKAELPHLADSWHDGMLVVARLPPSISSVFPNNYLVPFYTPGWKEVLWEWSVLPRNTTQNPVRSRTQSSRNEIQRTAYWAIASVGRLKKWSFQVKLSNQRDLFFIFNQFVSSPSSFLVLNLLG